VNINYTAPPPTERIVPRDFNITSRSAETDEKRWVTLSGLAAFPGLVSTAVPNPITIRTQQLDFSGVTDLKRPHIFGDLSFDIGSAMQGLVEITSPVFLAPARVSEKGTLQSGMAELISHSESLRTVAVAVFNNMRPLTNKERQYLGKFYSRAYKAR
jgi:hypothetical protein